MSPVTTTFKNKSTSFYLSKLTINITSKAHSISPESYLTLEIFVLYAQLEWICAEICRRALSLRVWCTVQWSIKMSTLDPDWQFCETWSNLCVMELDEWNHSYKYDCAIAIRLLSNWPCQLLLFLVDGSTTGKLHHDWYSFEKLLEFH